MSSKLKKISCLLFVYSLLFGMAKATRLKLFKKKVPICLYYILAIIQVGGEGEELSVKKVQSKELKIRFHTA